MGKIKDMIGGRISKMRKLKIILMGFGILVVLSTGCFAGDYCFECTVRNEYRLTDGGQLVKPERYYSIGQTFTIDRRSGRIIGGPFHNVGSDYQVKVVERGSSYKILTFSPRRPIAESLTISRADGVNIPFIGIDYLQVIVTGTCW